MFGTFVFFHELGHFLTAKLAGIVVYEFALGFGPRLIQKKVGATVYSIRVLPLGGFVKLAGMDEAESEADSVDERHPGNFNNKPLLVRMATIASGPLMNFLLAAAILALYAALVVIPPTIVSLQPGYPAEQAGLMLEDQVIRVNDVKVRDLDHLISEIESSPGKALNLTIKRAGELIEVDVIPASEDGRGILGVDCTPKPGRPWRTRLSKVLPRCGYSHVKQSQPLPECSPEPSNLRSLGLSGSTAWWGTLPPMGLEV